MIQCTNGADCSGARCHNNAICAFDCTNAASCADIDCVNNAMCLVDCTGATVCDFDICAGGEMSCPGDIIVCNRACP